MFHEVVRGKEHPHQQRGWIRPRRCGGRRRSIVGAVRRIVVGVHGSLGSLQALRWAADEAHERQVPLVPVIAWVPPGGDLAERSHPSPYLRRVWQETARRRLSEAFDEGLGGIPDGLHVR